MTPKPDLSKWLNDAEACQALGISPRTLHREVEQKRLHPQFRPRPGTKPERVFSPEQIAERMPPAPSVALARREDPATIPPISPATAELAEMPPVTWPDIINLVAEMIAEKTPEAPTIWVRLKEASDVTGLSQALLRRLIEQGDIEALRDRSLKLRRDGLETLDVRSAMVKPPKKRSAKK